MSNPAAPRRWAARFSLLTVLLVVTIVALTVAVTKLAREVGPLRVEIAKLRDEVGQLNITDRTKLHALRVETDNALEWKWRLWIPAGASYRLRCCGNKVSATGFPEDGGTMYLREPGEQVVRYVISRDARDGRWKGKLHTSTGSVGGDDHVWVEWPSTRSTSSGVGSSTQSYAPHERVEIVRHLVSQSTSTTDMEDPAAGFLIWLEPN